MRNVFVCAAVVLVFALSACSSDTETEPLGDRDQVAPTTSAPAATSAAVVEQVRNEGASMHPTIADGDIVDVLSYGAAVPERGDIIEFWATDLPGRVRFKRIVGLPGESVEIRGGAVFVDNSVLQEEYAVGLTSCSAPCAWAIPSSGSNESEDSCGSGHCYFVLGDNRQNSADSRMGWLVAGDQIIGWIDR